MKRILSVDNKTGPTIASSLMGTQVLLSLLFHFLPCVWTSDVRDTVLQQRPYGADQRQFVYLSCECRTNCLHVPDSMANNTIIVKALCCYMCLSLISYSSSRYKGNTYSSVPSKASSAETDESIIQRH